MTGSEFFITSKACEFIFEGYKEKGKYRDIATPQLVMGVGQNRKWVCGHQERKVAASLTLRKENSRIWEASLF